MSSPLSASPSTHCPYRQYPSGPVPLPVPASVDSDVVVRPSSRTPS
eukprot:CAMPEP_0117652564 /NCGR_PEP_ID=MMETSP0804-20121206/2695_1 /TAXON_ID=1074897 /ORGANISM="Tetraselmis astigmatica, Strain CCMP880" /LENGTH=45 /DNA_ID= /DNA_START= /DNA_END= /DNA_ORIENTATION=